MGKKIPSARAVENEVKASVAYLDITLMILLQRRIAMGQRSDTLLPTENHPVETLTRLDHGCVGSRIPMDRVLKDRDIQAEKWNQEYMDQYNRAKKTKKMKKKCIDFSLSSLSSLL